MLCVLEASPPLGMPSFPNRHTICAALAEQIVSDRHTVRTKLDELGTPCILILPRYKRLSLHDISNNPAVYLIRLDEDEIRIEVNRDTGHRTAGVIAYEDPSMFEQIGGILARFGVRFVS